MKPDCAKKKSMQKNGIFLVIDGLRYDVVSDREAASEVIPNIAYVANQGDVAWAVANAQATQFVLPALKKYFGIFEMVSVEEEIYESIENIKIDKNFKGFIDLVIYTPDTKKFHVIDWKTCSWGWDSRKKTDKMITYQLSLYKHFWAKKHNKDYKDITTHFALLKRTANKNNVEIFKVSNGEKKIGNALKLLNKAVYNINKCNHVKNRLSCYGKYGVCEYYKTKHCS